MKKTMIRLFVPDALPGDSVQVHNYRKRGNQWEWGECCSAEYRMRSDGTGCWHYRVRLYRRTPSNKYMDREYGNNPIFLYVGEDGISGIRKYEVLMGMTAEQEGSPTDSQANTKLPSKLAPKATHKD